MAPIESWTVTIEIAVPRTQHQPSRLRQGHQPLAGSQANKLLDLLKAYTPAINISANQFYVTLQIQSAGPKNAATVALQVLQESVEKAKILNTQLHLHSSQRSSNFTLQPELPLLVGVTEAANLLQVKPQRISQLARTPHFPKPAATLAAGPIWREADIVRFAASWERKPGRPPVNMAAAIQALALGGSDADLLSFISGATLEEINRRGAV